VPVKKISRNQLLINLPLEAAREAVWRAFVAKGMPDAVIDLELGQVVGQTGAGVRSYGVQYWASFEPQPDGTLITMGGKLALRGLVDLGSTRNRVAQMTKALIPALNAESAPGAATAPAGPGMAPASPEAWIPIASPTGEVSKFRGNPVYGTAPMLKQGKAVLIFGVVSMLCCSYAAPFAVFYAWRALREYGDRDPGDRNLVLWGIGTGIAGCCLLTVRLYVLFAMNR